ncbi:MAG: hypothetical protein AAB403_14750 [Planctomycetota bacterium]
MKFLCSLEAMNLDNMFRDCQDLSTIRGGGLSILNIADRVREALQAEQISGGASQGLLIMESESAEAAETSVRSVLESVPILKHATIMISVEPYDPAKFKEQRAMLKARNRWRQMQAPSVIYPKLEGNEVCQVDRVRPGRDRQDLPEKGVQSDFTADRRTLGREEKKKLLQDILGVHCPDDFGVVKDLNELSGGGEEMGNTKDKIAVLRFDGNSFGKIVNDCGPEELKEFSGMTRDQQTAFFRELVTGEQYQRYGWTGRKLRLEILVYGGDEVTFVVPAWLGWEALHCFYEQAREWQPFLGKDITYSGGVVFCHRNAPIHAVRDLASGLADQAKLLRAGKGKGNYAAYQVLESFDSVGRDLEEYIRERYRPFGGDESMLLDCTAIGFLKDEMSWLRRGVSRRQLHRLVHGLAKGVTPADWEIARKSLTDASSEEAAKKIQVTLEQLQNKIGPVGYLHVLELWDYIGAADEERGGGWQ